MAPMLVCEVLVLLLLLELVSCPAPAPVPDGDGGRLIAEPAVVAPMEEGSEEALLLPCVPPVMGVLAPPAALMAELPL
jgi:hypothetical protein